MKDNKQYGAITEQGDLGLGFDIFNEQDQNTIRKTEEKNKKNKDKEDMSKYYAGQGVSLYPVLYSKLYIKMRDIDI